MLTNTNGRAVRAARPFPDFGEGETAMSTLDCFLRDERGATAVEYGLIATMIAVAIIGAAGLIGTNLNTIFQDLTGTINGP